jgi:heterodisulfide reductase subunit B
MVTHPDIFKNLIGKILTKAKETGADCVIAACSMCQMNLDTCQAIVDKDLGKKLDLPIFYYSELMGLAMGHKDTAKWFKRHFTDPIPMLRAKGLM